MGKKLVQWRIKRSRHDSKPAEKTKQRKRLSRVAIVGFTLGFIVFGASAGVAYAAASSSLVNWRSAGQNCFYHQASTQNSAPLGQSGDGINYVMFNAISGCNNNPVSANIGIAAYLLKTNGAACASSGAAYVTGQSITRYAFYSSSACGSNVSLQGSITSYAYNGSGYSSASIAAPFQTFN